MSEINRILNQMDRAYSGEAWHGPDLKHLLEGISAEDASKHPVAGAHSIWELVNHIAAWNTIVQQKSKGEPVDVTTELDWPPVWEASEVTWKRALEHFAESRTRLRDYVKTLRDDQLDEPILRENYSRYVLLHGLVQHDLYHAGQIAVLKKGPQMTESKESLRSFAADRAAEFAVEIREAQPRDSARLAELAEQLGYPSSAHDIARRLDGMKHSNEHAVFVAQLGDKIAGWLGAYVCRTVEADARSEISGLVVDERYRSQGVGPLLLDRAEHWAREKGCRTIGLRSNVIRDRAHSFYERHGYKHTKTQKSFRKVL